MIPTGKFGQVQETLLGKAAYGRGGHEHGRLKPPFGEVYVDKAGRPCAVVCHMYPRKMIPVIQGLEYAVAPGPRGLVKVTYRKA